MCATTRPARKPALPASATLNRWGWGWNDALTVDENYMDLAFLLARGSFAPPEVGCVFVRDVEDGTARHRQGVEIVSAVNSFILTNRQVPMLPRDCPRTALPRGVPWIIAFRAPC